MITWDESKLPRVRIPLMDGRGGVYLLKDASRVVYVGRSGDFLFRMGGHREKQFDEVEFIFCDSGVSESLEKRLIRKYLPQLNSKLVPSKYRRGPLRNFRFREDLDEFLVAESERTGRDMTLYLEQALGAFKKLKPAQRDSELQKALQ